MRGQLELWVNQRMASERVLSAHSIRAFFQVANSAVGRAKCVTGTPASVLLELNLLSDALEKLERAWHDAKPPRQSTAPTLFERLRKLHRAYGIYTECVHDHEPDDPGVVFVDDIGYTCEKLYDICAECCRDGNNQSEACLTHDHGPNKAICKTAEVLATVEALFDARQMAKGPSGAIPGPDS